MAKKVKKATATKKAATAKKKTKTKKSNLDKLNETGRRANDVPVKNERRKTHRRRQIDPTTCEREYKEQEIEFMHAMDEYKRASGRMFPTCSEILEVLQNLGYRQIAERQDIYSPGNDKEESLQSGEIEKFEEDLETV